MWFNVLAGVVECISHQIIDSKWHENILINNVSWAGLVFQTLIFSYEHHLAPAAARPIERSILVLLLFQESP
jgi:hypothetical protein